MELAAYTSHLVRVTRSKEESVDHILCSNLLKCVQFSNTKCPCVRDDIAVYDCCESIIVLLWVGLALPLITAYTLILLEFHSSVFPCLLSTPILLHMFCFHKATRSEDLCPYDAIQLLYFENFRGSWTCASERLLWMQCHSSRFCLQELSYRICMSVPTNARLLSVHYPCCDI